MLSPSFYQRDAEIVAKALLGKVIVHKYRGKTLKARIVETEAYVGTHDLACHASKGRTKRTEIMFGAAGHIYVYLIYGMYEMFNIVTGSKDDAQAVLIRAAEPLNGLDLDLSGPGKFTRGLKISGILNGHHLFERKIFLENGGKPKTIKKAPRIGVDYAGIWKDKHLRFYISESKAVSKR